MMMMPPQARLLLLYFFSFEGGERDTGEGTGGGPWWQGIIHPSIHPSMQCIDEQC